MMNKVLTSAVFGCFAFSTLSFALAGMAQFQAPGQALSSQAQPLPNNGGAVAVLPGLDINVDANAIIQNWRRHQALSRNGTGPRSGVRINGRRVGALSQDDEYLFACPPGGFLEISFGHVDQDGGLYYGGGNRGGCEAGQALVLNGDRLSCRWYTPRRSGVAHRFGPVTRGKLLPAAEILLSAQTGTTILGECITANAEVVPANLFPEGRRTVGLDGLARPDCLNGGKGSGVMINGRVTGHRALCGQ